MQKFSENPKDRITWRTIKSIAITWDITWKKVLNIGTLGWWYEDWLLRENSFENLTWLDLPGKYINDLKETNNKQRVTFLEWDVTEELPFPNNTFDIVAMWEVLEHLPKDKELFGLLEIDRVLKKGGKLILSTPYADWRSRLLDPVWYFGHRHYNEKEIKFLLSEAGFFDFKIEKYGWYYELFTMILFYFCKHILRREVPFKEFFENKRKLEFERPWFTNIFVTAIKINET